MDVEFHYWITGILAKSAGYSPAEAATIAYAAQYVDDNEVRLPIRDPATGEVYRNYISQTIDIRKPKRELMRIYPIFHFVPGDPFAATARRRDGKMHLLTTTPGNVNARTLLDKAFAATASRLYRIGIASHAFADTWAHQNFVGWFDDFNGLRRPAPNIGHADAGVQPDCVGHVWIDARLVDRAVRNDERFLAAARALFDRYCLHVPRPTSPRLEWPEVERMLSDAMSERTPEARLARYRFEAPWLPDYSRARWLDEAVVTKVRGMRDRVTGVLSLLPRVFPDAYTWRTPEWRESHWYQFQEAVRAHQAEGMALMVPIYEQMAVDLRAA